MSDVVLLQQRRRHVDARGPHAVVRLRADGQRKVLARFADRRAASEYVNSLRQLGANVELQQVPAVVAEDPGAA